jgi:hypothetical protein
MNWIETSTWNFICGYNLATYRRGHSAVVYNNAMYIFGGVSSSKNSNDLYEFCFGMFFNFNNPSGGGSLFVMDTTLVLRLGTIWYSFFLFF